MRKIYLILLLSMQSFSCTDLLDTEIRKLDSAEVINLCEFQDEVILVVNVLLASDINVLPLKVIDDDLIPSSESK